MGLGGGGLTATCEDSQLLTVSPLTDDHPQRLVVLRDGHRELPLHATSEAKLSYHSVKDLD